MERRGLLLGRKKKGGVRVSPAFFFSEANKPYTEVVLTEANFIKPSHGRFHNQGPRVGGARKTLLKKAANRPAYAQASSMNWRSSSAVSSSASADAAAAGPAPATGLRLARPQRPLGARSNWCVTFAGAGHTRARKGEGRSGGRGNTGGRLSLSPLLKKIHNNHWWGGGRMNQEKTGVYQPVLEPSHRRRQRSGR